MTFISLAYAGLLVEQRQRIIEMSGDRTISSMLFSITGLVLIICFAYSKKVRQHHKPE